MYYEHYFYMVSSIRIKFAMIMCYKCSLMACKSCLILLHAWWDSFHALMLNDWHFHFRTIHLFMSVIDRHNASHFNSPIKRKYFLYLYIFFITNSIEIRKRKLWYRQYTQHPSNVHGNLTEMFFMILTIFWNMVYAWKFEVIFTDKTQLC